MLLSTVFFSILWHFLNYKFLYQTLIYYFVALQLVITSVGQFPNTDHFQKQKTNFGSSLFLVLYVSCSLESCLGIFCYCLKFFCQQISLERMVIFFRFAFSNTSILYSHFFNFLMNLYFSPKIAFSLSIKFIPIYLECFVSIVNFKYFQNNFINICLDKVLLVCRNSVNLCSDPVSINCAELSY